VDLFEDNGYEMLMRALRARANRIGATLLKTKKPPKPTGEKPSEQKKIKYLIGGAVSLIMLVLMLILGLPSLIKTPVLTPVATNAIKVKSFTPTSPLSISTTTELKTFTPVLASEIPEITRTTLSNTKPPTSILAPNVYKYDFGTSSSPVASGYTRVTEMTTYSAGSAGWTDTSGLESRDRSAVTDDLQRDFVMHSSAARTFKVDLPNGAYSVSLIMGDSDYARDNMVVKVNGIAVLADVDSDLGAFTVNAFNVTFSDGFMSLEFSDGGGVDPSWVINALTITTQ
jgi:hypothetical protein